MVRWGLLAFNSVSTLLAAALFLWQFCEGLSQLDYVLMIIDAVGLLGVGLTALGTVRVYTHGNRRVSAARSGCAYQVLGWLLLIGAFFSSLMYLLSHVFQGVG